MIASYTEIMVSDGYPELVKLFGKRVAEQAEKTRITLNGSKIQGIPNAPITARGCEVISYQYDIKGTVVVIKPNILRREYRRATCQLRYVSAALVRIPTVAALSATTRSCTLARPCALNGVGNLIPCG